MFTIAWIMLFRPSTKPALSSDPFVQTKTSDCRSNTWDRWKQKSIKIRIISCPSSLSSWTISSSMRKNKSVAFSISSGRTSNSKVYNRSSRRTQTSRIWLFKFWTTNTKAKDPTWDNIWSACLSWLYSNPNSLAEILSRALSPLSSKPRSTKLRKSRSMQSWICNEFCKNCRKK